MDLTKFGDFSTLFHQYGIDVILYFEEEEAEPWKVSLILNDGINSYFTRSASTYQEAMEALMDAYQVLLYEDEDVVVVA